MRNILKSFLEPKAEAYVLPDTDDIFMGGEDEFRPLEAEEIAPEPLDITAGGEEEPEPAPEEPEEAPKKETPVHYAQLQAELILSKAREEAQQILDQARDQAMAEQEEIRAGARDEGYREGYAQDCRT